MNKLTLNGLDLAPAQVLGSVRLVPLIRRVVREDLRLSRRAYHEDLAVVALGGDLAYASFVPHGLVASWSDDGAAAPAVPPKRDGVTIGRHARVMHRMARREDERALRFLPLHLAMEGFLALCFAGPDIQWPEWSRRAITRGLDPRMEWSVRGAGIADLGDALRLFEIHERQTGVLVFIADALASAFVVPHPEDYRALHRTLIEDFYGELLYSYGLFHTDLAPAEATIDADSVSSLDELRAALGRMRRDWAEFGEMLAGGALGRELRSEVVYRLGAFELSRFTTSLRLHEENHIGEAIVRDDGTMEYLKTYRLSDAQARRAYLLQHIAAHGWKLPAAADALGVTLLDLVRRLDSAGFGHLVRADLLSAARAPR